MLAADYPFLDVLWTMLIFFAWVIWFWLLITVFADIFRRHDTSGGVKVLWVIFVIILPFLGVFIYLIAEHDGMAEHHTGKTLVIVEAGQDLEAQAVHIEGQQRLDAVGGASDPERRRPDVIALGHQRVLHCPRLSL